MVKKVLILLVIPLVLGCGSSKKAEEKENEQARAQQVVKNIMKEDVLLLAAKYEISEGRLTEILIDYEIMTIGISATEVMAKVYGKDKPGIASKGEPVDISTALNQISEKYAIPVRTLSTIILEKKMLEAKSKG